MEQHSTTFTVTHDPELLENLEKRNQEEEQNNQSADAPNTGMIQQVSSSSTIPATPFIAGGCFFLGIVLLALMLRTISKHKDVQRRGFVSNDQKTLRKVRTLATFSILAFLGGAIDLAYFDFSSEATDTNKFSTSSKIAATLDESLSTKDYAVYCGVDTITAKVDTDYGYRIYAKALDGATLTAEGSQKDIASLDEWSKLQANSWGFKTNKETYEEVLTGGEYKPLNLGYGVIYSNSDNEATKAGDTVNVNYCVRVDASTPTETYTGTIDYQFIIKDETFISYVPEFDFDSEEDSDFDGLSNREETRYGSNLGKIDTDSDGLSDQEEVDGGTDPISVDTDNDGLADYSELELGFDPLKADTKGDGIKDGEREVEYTIKDEENNIEYTLTGTGNLPLTYIEVNDGITSADLETEANLEEETESTNDELTNYYQIISSGNVDAATVTIERDLGQTLADSTCSEEGGDCIEVEDIDTDAAEEVLKSLSFNIAEYDEDEDTLGVINDSDVEVESTTVRITTELYDAEGRFAVSVDGADSIDDETESENSTQNSSYSASKLLSGSGDDDTPWIERTRERIRTNIKNFFGNLFQKIRSRIRQLMGKEDDGEGDDSGEIVTKVTSWDSGFRAGKNGFAFSNLRIGGGTCLGISQFAKAYYEGHLYIPEGYLMPKFGTQLDQLNNAKGRDGEGLYAVSLQAKSIVNNKNQGTAYDKLTIYNEEVLGKENPTDEAKMAALLTYMISKMQNLDNEEHNKKVVVTSGIGIPHKLHIPRIDKLLKIYFESNMDKEELEKKLGELSVDELLEILGLDAQTTIDIALKLMLKIAPFIESIAKIIDAEAYDINGFTDYIKKELSDKKPVNANFAYYQNNEAVGGHSVLIESMEYEGTKLVNGILRESYYAQIYDSNSSYGKRGIIETEGRIACTPVVNVCELYPVGDNTYDQYTGYPWFGTDFMIYEFGGGRKNGIFIEFDWLIDSIENLQ